MKRHTNKKMIYIIAIIILFIIVIPIAKNTKGALMVYLDDYFQTTEDIITIEYADGGAYVFKNFSEENNVCFFIRKSFFGWKYDYDVHNGGLGPLIKQSGFTITDLPKVRHVNYPVYFGKIIDEEIDRITFKNIDTSEIKNALIIKNENIKLWIMYPNDLEKDQFILSAYSNENELISEVAITLNEIKYTYYKNLEEGIQLKTLMR